MAIFKQSTPYTHQFLMVLSSDHVSGATGKTVTVKLGKNGASGTTAAGSVTEVDAANLPGVYQIQFTVADVNTLGSLALAATAAGCDPTNETHQVQSQIFTDLSINASGQVLIGSNFKQNTAVAFFPFVMTINGVPTAGLTVTAQRNFGSGFSAMGGTVTSLGNGTYGINLLAADTNAASALYRFTAAGADDRDIAVFFQP